MIALLAGVVLFFAGVFGTGVSLVDDTGERISEPVVGDEQPPESGEEVVHPGRNYNETIVERMIFEKVNEIRNERGLEPLNHNERAQNKAKEHARDQAVNDYFSHTSLDGESQQERYAFCRGGENNALTWVGRQLETEDGRVLYNTNEELANGLVSQWMNSEPHREDGILGELWISSGVGVYITDNGKVLAVQAFCSF